MSFVEAVGSLRQPAYTGANRCWPCTGVNSVIAVVLAAILGFLAPLGPAGSLTVGAGALLVFALAIAFRGYLVPGTPQLTKTYLPDWFLRYFDHGAMPTTPAGAGGDLDHAAILEAAGAVAECEDVDDLCLTEAFRAAWDARIDGLRGTEDARRGLAAVLDLPADTLTIEDHGEAFVAMADGGQFGGAEGETWRVGQWESGGAFLADVAAASLLEARYDGWADLEAAERGQVLNGLRLFIEECPSCGGDVEFGEETVESCCRSMDVVVVTCVECGDRLFEAPQPAEA